MGYDLLVCPVCAGTEFADMTTKWPHAARCGGCGLGVERSVVLPRGAYRPEAYDAARNDGYGSDRWARFHHDAAVAHLRLAQLESALPPRKGVWVDVGCNNGAFLTAARRRGWLPLGVEAEAEACRETADRLDLAVVPYQVWAGSVRAGQGPPATAVSGFDLVEHLLDPVHFLQTAAAALDGDGALVVEVPDLDACGGDFEGWRHRRVAKAAGGHLGSPFTEHLYHFSEATLTKLAALHLPAMRAVRVARPVPGKLQVVWRKAAAQTPAPAPRAQPQPPQVRPAQRPPAGPRR